MNSTDLIGALALGTLILVIALGLWQLARVRNARARHAHSDVGQVRTPAPQPDGISRDGATQNPARDRSSTR